MSFDPKKIHMIPPIVVQKGETILADTPEHVVKENYAAQLEQIILYCEDILAKYNKKNRIKRNVEKVSRKQTN